MSKVNLLALFLGWFQGYNQCLVAAEPNRSKHAEANMPKFSSDRSKVILRQAEGTRKLHKGFLSRLSNLKEDRVTWTESHRVTYRTHCEPRGVSTHPSIDFPPRLSVSILLHAARNFPMSQIGNFRTAYDRIISGPFLLCR